MADTTGGSPWDEPAPEETQSKKPTPTVIGDLDVNKKPPLEVGNAEQKPAELKIPTDTEEKVGAKVDPNINQTSNSSPPVQPTPKKPEVDSDFWQTVYGQEGNPDGRAPAKPAIPKPAMADIGPAAATPSPNPAIPIKPMIPSNQVPTTPAAPPAPPASVPKPPAMPAANPPAGGSTNRIKTLIIAGIIGIIILFAGGVFLTEKGLISIGLEKAYGLAHLEALWGGLPANAENAFAISAVKMKSEKSFKMSGSATVTVNKGVKSDIISPIVSSVALPIFSLSDLPAGRQDEQIGPKIKAVLAVASDQASTDSSTNLFQDTSGSTTDQSTGSSQTQSSTGSNSNITTVQELTTNISAQITDTISGAKIGIKSSKSPSSEINLVYSKNKIYLKTTPDIVYGSQAKGSWASLDLKKFGTDSPGSALFGSNFSGSSFSIVGSRESSETVNGIRCFHYSGKATIGDSLGSFGLKDGSVSSLDLDYWLGVNDHFIHRLTMKIVPGSDSAISRIDISLDFSDFGGGSADFIVPASSLPYTVGTANSADLTSAKTRDNQRKTDLANIAKALESYHSAIGKYPQVSGTEKISASSGVLNSTLVPTYINAMPIDPQDPTNYYGYESNGTTYKLSSILEDTTDASGKKIGSAYLYFLSSL